MKTLKTTVTINLIIGFFSVLAMIFLFLALTDIAHNESDLSFEWKIAGISMIVLSAFMISSFIILGTLLKNWNRLFKE